MREHSEPPAAPDSEAISRRQPDGQLEELWRQGQRPDVRAFLAGVSSLAGVVGVLAVDQRQRWQRGERVPVEAYLQLYPGLEVDAEKALELIYGEFLLREELGETPSLDDYVRRRGSVRAMLLPYFELVVTSVALIAWLYSLLYKLYYDLFAWDRRLLLLFVFFVLALMSVLRSWPWFLRLVLHAGWVSLFGMVFFK
jgi:hypothetical protein